MTSAEDEETPALTGMLLRISMAYPLLATMPLRAKTARVAAKKSPF